MNEHQRKAIQQIFGAPVEALSNWPGLFVFCANLESHFRELLNGRFIVILKILNKTCPMTLVDIWHWCSVVFGAFDTLRTNHNDASIERAFQEITRQAAIPVRSISAQEKKTIILAIFAVLCWCSAALCPVLGDDGPAGADANAVPAELRAEGICLTAKNSSRLHSTRDLRRPLSKMFFSFRSRTLAGDDGARGDADGRALPVVRVNPNDDVLYASSLDFFSLYTIGQVRLKWVDTLTAHLAFDRSTRTLSLYRYPSHCAINILRRDDPITLKKLVYTKFPQPPVPTCPLTTSFHFTISLTPSFRTRSITANLFPPNYYSGVPEEPAALYREILLSYRMIFGQSSKSRDLLLRTLARHDQTAGGIDPFLRTVCMPSPRRPWPWSKPVPDLPSTLFPESAVGLDGMLQEPSAYSARDDFPVFGGALLAVQRYSLRHQPSRVRDLWRDRRNPLQWYTFWAVIAFGGMSIVLSVLQLSVSTAQLYYDVTSA